MKQVYEPIYEFTFVMKNGNKITGEKYFKVNYGEVPSDIDICYTDIDDLIANHKYINYDEPLLFKWNTGKYLRADFLWDHKLMKINDIKIVHIHKTFNIKNYTIRTLANELDADKFIEYVADRHMEYDAIFREALK